MEELIIGVLVYVGIFAIFSWSTTAILNFFARKYSVSKICRCVLSNYYTYGADADKEYMSSNPYRLERMEKTIGESKDARGMAALGLAYLKGLGVDKDEEKAISWLLRAIMK